MKSPIQPLLLTGQPATALVFLALVGCAPQDAEVSGRWFAWLAANSSASVAEDALPDLADTATIFECKRGWDSRTEDWEDGYIGPRQDDDPTDPRYWGGDCDPSDDDCMAEKKRDHAEGETPNMKEECDAVDAMEGYTFLQDDGYYALTGELDPWRTEALLNGEGDLQLTVHHRLGDNQDFRYAFSINPNFNPVTCTTDENGEPTIEYVDGADWLTEWSADEDGYTIYYLNAGLAQQNPADNDIYWFLTSDWSSGYGRTKFASEEGASDPGYTEEALDVSQREDPEAAAQDYLDAALDFTATSDAWALEMNEVAGATVNGTSYFTHKVEDNTWREVDSSDNGLDGWMELHASWVRIKNGSTIEKGGSVEGDYQIYFLGSESGSVFLVSGSFKIDKLREDHWAYPVLEDDKREENGTPYCGGAAMP